jgi:hypothetical protein
VQQAGKRERVGDAQCGVCVVAGACAVQQCNKGVEHVLCCGDDLCVCVQLLKYVYDSACARCGGCVCIAAVQ